MRPEHLSCPNCDEPVTADQRWCRNCGGHLADLDLSADPTTGRRLWVIVLVLTLLAAGGAGVVWWMQGREPGPSDIASIALADVSPTAPDVSARETATMEPRNGINPATAVYLSPTTTPTADSRAVKAAVSSGNMPTASPIPSREQTALVEVTPSPPPYVPESYYTSSFFGYSFGWDDSWDSSWSSSGPGFDQMVITNGVSSLAFTGTDSYGGNSERCIEGVANGMAASPDIVQLGRAENVADNPLVSTSSDSRSASFVFSVGSGASSERRVAHVECIVLVPGQMDLAIVHSAPASEAEGEGSAIRAVVNTLRLPDESAAH